VAGHDRRLDREAGRPSWPWRARPGRCRSDQLEGLELRLRAHVVGVEDHALGDHGVGCRGSPRSVGRASCSAVRARRRRGARRRAERVQHAARSASTPSAPSGVPSAGLSCCRSTPRPRGARPRRGRARRCLVAGCSMSQKWPVTYLVASLTTLSGGAGVAGDPGTARCRTLLTSCTCRTPCRRPPAGRSSICSFVHCGRRASPRSRTAPRSRCRGMTASRPAWMASRAWRACDRRAASPRRGRRLGVDVVLQLEHPLGLQPHAVHLVAGVLLDRVLLAQGGVLHQQVRHQPQAAGVRRSSQRQ
jgi:hypothetical protein